MGKKKEVSEKVLPFFCASVTDYGQRYKSIQKIVDNIHIFAIIL